MPVDASLGFGTKLFWSTDGTVYTELADLVTMGPVDDAKREQVDVTPLSPTNNRREFRPALYGATVFTFRQFWNAARVTALKTHRDSGTMLHWRYCFPDHATPGSASKYEWQGTLTQWRPDGAELTKPNHLDGEVQVSGDVTFTPKAA